MAGPLQGLKIVEFAGIGPGPFCAMMLADHGAHVIRIERPGGARGGLGGDPSKNVLLRSRTVVTLDLKVPADRDRAREMCRDADGLIEGFRPGVMERLGLGPDTLLRENPHLVYGRMTGWGQEGPYAQSAGHDINYIALSGALHACGRRGQPPTPPLNLLGDFGGGGLLLAFGMVSAILHAQRTGIGQVVDAAIVDGAALLMGAVWGWYAQGMWQDERGANLLDTGAPFYDTYETADARYISIGSLEPQFYATLLQKLGLDGEIDASRQMDRSTWDGLKARLADIFRTRTLEQWSEAFEGTDVCFAPVLSLADAPKHPHNRARKTFVEIAGVVQPAPAPRYSVTGTEIPRTRSAESGDER